MTAHDIYQTLVRADTELRREIATTAYKWHAKNRDKIISDIANFSVKAAVAKLGFPPTAGMRAQAAEAVKKKAAKDWAKHLEEAAATVVYITGDKKFADSPYCVLPNPDFGDNETKMDWMEAKPEEYIKLARNELQRMVKAPAG